ncbi:uncharacterized protein MELLADRAFT_105371 [Melampsora larici-populina 98AG31]|uniref:Secreted protein n=1 Tax=Melampsora larici-populina (strain 98AG31 / pathotype 3-4-7) TaxID=747676 RepID=F4RHX1_MELLP|nr:uncharacterized protein MELLADRAFT_105371 [Melampsora larici-populina 98AG31]EGG08058.1 hypothetical protein MELLADRAFT_105371 [Melampsora larici-populina 98AG31]
MTPFLVNFFGGLLRFLFASFLSFLENCYYYTTHSVSNLILEGRAITEEHSINKRQEEVEENIGESTKLKQVTNKGAVEENGGLRFPNQFQPIDLSSPGCFEYGTARKRLVTEEEIVV